MLFYNAFQLHDSSSIECGKVSWTVRR